MISTMAQQLQYAHLLGLWASAFRPEHRVSDGVGATTHCLSFELAVAQRFDATLSLVLRQANIKGKVAYFTVGLALRISLLPDLFILILISHRLHLWVCQHLVSAPSPRFHCSTAKEIEAGLHYWGTLSKTGSGLLFFCLAAARPTFLPLLPSQEKPSRSLCSALLCSWSAPLGVPS